MSLKTKLERSIVQMGPSFWGSANNEVKKLGDLSESILFIGDHEPKRKGNEVDFDFLPFSDFMFLSNVIIEDRMIFRESMLIRVIDKGDYLQATSFIKPPRQEGKFAVFLSVLIFKENNQFRPQYWRGIPNKEEDSTVRDTFAVGIREAVISFLQMFQSHVVVEDNSPVRSYSVSKKPKSLHAKYVEYTIDVSQKRKRKKGNGKGKSGTDRSPTKEHERIGHTRTYKSGKVVRIKAMTICKGRGTKDDSSSQKVYKL